MQTAAFKLELDIQTSKGSVRQHGHLVLSAATEIQVQGYFCFHWQCGKNSLLISLLPLFLLQ